MGRLVAMSKRTRAVILLQTFLIIGLVSGLWVLDAKDQGLFGLPNLHDAAESEKRILLSDKHNVLMIPSAPWQRELIKRMEARGALADKLMAGRLTLLQTA